MANEKTEEMALAVVLCCYMIWGGGMVAMKFALQSFSAIQIVTARVVCPAMLYLCLWPYWRNEKIRTGDWKIFATLTLCEPCLFFLCVTYAMRFTSASEAGVIAASLPIFIAFGAWLVLKETMKRMAIIGTILTVGGILGMNFFAGDNSYAPQPLLGNCLMLAGIIFSALYTLCARYLAEKYSALLISAFQAIGASLIFIPVCFFQPAPRIITVMAVGGLAYLGLGIGICVYISYNWAMRWTKAAIAGILANFTPIVSMILAYFLLGERLGMGQLISMGVALSGIFLASFTINQK